MTLRIQQPGDRQPGALNDLALVDPARSAG